MTNPTKSIFDLNVDELESILASNELPPEITLEGIEQRKDFDKLFKHRANPKAIAQILLKEKVKDRLLAEPTGLKNQRLQLKQAELEYKQLKLNTTSDMQKNIYRYMQKLDTGNLMIMGALNNLQVALNELSLEIKNIKEVIK